MRRRFTIPRTALAPRESIRSRPPVTPSRIYSSAKQINISSDDEYEELVAEVDAVLRELE